MLLYWNDREIVSNFAVKHNFECTMNACECNTINYMYNDIITNS